MDGVMERGEGLGAMGLLLLVVVLILLFQWINGNSNSNNLQLASGNAVTNQSLVQLGQGLGSRIDTLQANLYDNNQQQTTFLTQMKMQDQASEIANLKAVALQQESLRYIDSKFCSLNESINARFACLDSKVSYINQNMVRLSPEVPAAGLVQSTPPVFGC